MLNIQYWVIPGGVSNENTKYKTNDNQIANAFPFFFLLKKQQQIDLNAQLLQLL